MPGFWFRGDGRTIVLGIRLGDRKFWFDDRWNLPVERSFSHGVGAYWGGIRRGIRGKSDRLSQANLREGLWIVIVLPWVRTIGY